MKRSTASTLVSKGRKAGLTKRVVRLVTQGNVAEAVLPNGEEVVAVEFHDTDLFDPMEDRGMGRQLLVMDAETWEHFGSPDEITITIQPGDKLNEER